MRRETIHHQQFNSPDPVHRLSSTFVQLTITMPLPGWLLLKPSLALCAKAVVTATVPGIEEGRLLLQGLVDAPEDPQQSARTIGFIVPDTGVDGFCLLLRTYAVSCDDAEEAGLFYLIATALERERDVAKKGEVRH